MILVVGGAYQGKFEFVKNSFNIKDEDVFFCLESSEFIDFNKPVIKDLNVFVYSMIKNSKNPVNFVKENLHLFKDKIIICDDISSGIVPIDYHQRILREELGKSLVILSKKSDRVVRLFCGIPMDLK